MKKADMRALRYLYIITGDDAPVHCNYSKKNESNKKMSKDIMMQALQLCRSEELVPIFQGEIPDYVDMRNQIYFEITDKGSFRNAMTGITVINNIKEMENIESPVATFILKYSDINTFSKYVVKLFEQVKRINIFISDLEVWKEDEIASYEEELKKLSEFILQNISKVSTDIS